MWGFALLAAALALTPPSASAAGRSSNRLVTFAARYCREYTDIAANRARNNIQESLRDLGPDTLYVGGEAIKPSKELQQQPNCIPLPNWQFTLGRDYQTRAVVGPWGALTKVTDPFATSIVTRSSVPLLDVAGQPTGAQLAGAVTVELTPAEARLAASNALWVQGGLPEDPVLDRAFPSQYGFGALRCAIDNLNGDNVEWIAFPAGARHVFCYAYYVTPPPTSGTIVVRKVVDAPGTSGRTPFHFSGNISYTEEHDFTLSAGEGDPDSATFYRAATGPGDEPWTFTEDDLPGWRRTSERCVSETGASRAVTDVASGSAAVTLAAGDTVTCTVVNAIAPPPAGLELAKLTLGGVGSFPFAVAGPEDARQTLTTREEGVAVGGDPLSLEAGQYRLDETLPDGDAGRWAVDDVSCGGRSLGDALPVTLTLPAGEGRACLVTNRFTPAGSITLRKTTLGGTGTAGFVIDPDRAGPDGDSRRQSATTRAAGVPARASGDDTSALPLGTYEVVETGPAPGADGSWTLDAVVCDGKPVGSAQGRIAITLTAADPHVDCTFVNRFTAAEEPPIVVPTPPAPPTPPTPPTEPQGSGGVAGVVEANGPIARLSITKTVSPLVARPGQRVRYTVVVVNRGPDPATNVTAVELTPPSQRLVSVRSTRGRCDVSRRPIVCRIGRLGVGRRVVVTGTTRARGPGRVVNRVAVNAATSDPNLRDNRAAAALRVLRPAPPRFTG